MGERVVVVGHGAREHALAWKLARGSSLCAKAIRDVMVLGGNAGIARQFECVQLNPEQPRSIIEHCKRLSPDLVVIGPETYLSFGLADELRGEGFATFGPSKEAAQLEASKYFAKRICDKAQITTAAYQRFKDGDAARLYIEQQPNERLVVKVDGLCAGKGVSVCDSKSAAIDVVNQLYKHDGFARLGAQDHTLVIEDYLPGAEVSVFGLADGDDVALFCPMQDYKRLQNFDLGPNTGGMGAVGPLGGSKSECEQFLMKSKEQIFLPALRAMKEQGQPFRGLLYAGIMLVAGTPFLLEFNVRFGDPETQALLFGTNADIFPILNAIAHDAPIDTDYWQNQLLDMTPTIAVVMASGDYPHKKSAACVPLSLPTELHSDAELFFAACNQAEDGSLTAGSGRVLSVVARGVKVACARALGYEVVRKINFANAHYRSDIGTNISDLGTKG